MSDTRFNALATDPRYRLPSRKQSKTAVDPRFGRLFTDDDFNKEVRVDKYGRRIKPESGRNGLGKVPQKKPKPARKAEREVVGSSDEDSEDDDVEDEVLAEKRDPARQGGFSDSSSEEESASAEETEAEVELADETAGHEQTEDVPMGEVSRRIACVNLDWDNIRASDIMAVASSFVPHNGRIDSVTIYPSEFGQERLQREEIEGPPREIFASSKRNGRVEEDEEDGDESEEEEEDSEDDEKIKKQLQQSQVNEGEEFDTAKLRQYQLERLRYYYAVIASDSESTAKLLYDNMDGREYLATSNFFDLRFVPDSVSFDDDKPRDECTFLPSGYKPNDFRTEALTHSKAKLTWDNDDTTRMEVQKRAFSRQEIDENDLAAYVASDDSDNESVASRKSVAEDRKSKKEVERAKMRAALGLAKQSTKSSKKAADEVEGEVQVTFASALVHGKEDKNKGKGIFENEPQDEASTMQRYMQKTKERKQARKERSKARRAGEDAVVGEAADEEEAEQEDAGFDDPFFDDPAAAAAAEKKVRKLEKEKKFAAQTAKDADAAVRRKELELLTLDDQADNVRHFDMREVEKAEKLARRKGKKGKKDRKTGKEEVEAAAFNVDAKDPRFSALFESHEYAIDPTNSRFKGTQGMKALLEEGRKKRKAGEMEGEDRQISGKRDGNTGGDELQGLVKRLQSSKRSKAR